MVSYKGKAWKFEIQFLFLADDSVFIENHVGLLGARGQEMGHKSFVSVSDFHMYQPEQCTQTNCFAKSFSGTPHEPSPTPPPASFTFQPSLGHFSLTTWNVY